tara:strand:+ start:176 stop:721 length:546 start_codon:yes stop_codon:yes gene_type:complete
VVLIRVNKFFRRNALQEAKATLFEISPGQSVFFSKSGAVEVFKNGEEQRPLVVRKKIQETKVILPRGDLSIYAENLDDKHPFVLGCLLVGEDASSSGIFFDCAKRMMGLDIIFNVLEVTSDKGDMVMSLRKEFRAKGYSLLPRSVPEPSDFWAIHPYYRTSNSVSVASLANLIQSHRMVKI